jgi:hypothetical protein
MGAQGNRFHFGDRSVRKLAVVRKRRGMPPSKTLRANLGDADLLGFSERGADGQMGKLKSRGRFP